MNVDRPPRQDQVERPLRQAPLDDERRQYQDALTELKQLADASVDDEAAQRRKRELEADVEQYALHLKQSGERVGRPDPHRAMEWQASKTPAEIVRSEPSPPTGVNWAGACLPSAIPV